MNFTNDNPHGNPLNDTLSPSSPAWDGLKQRVISAVIAAGVALGALWIGGWWFNALIVTAALLMMREWDSITPRDSLQWKCGGVAYIIIPCASMLWLRGLSFADNPHGGMTVVLFVMLVVCATDIGAYFTGKRVGGPKLAPSISPGKTWAGLGGGIVAAALAGAIGASFSPYPPSAFAGLDLGVLLALVAQGGDLFESWLKRRANVKDSGTLLPGHGGILDRVDGLVAALPVFALLVWLSGAHS